MSGWWKKKFSINFNLLQEEIANYHFESLPRRAPDPLKRYWRLPKASRGAQLRRNLSYVILHFLSLDTAYPDIFFSLLSILDSLSFKFCYSLSLFPPSLFFTLYILYACLYLYSVFLSLSLLTIYSYFSLYMFFIPVSPLLYSPSLLLSLSALHLCLSLSLSLPSSYPPLSPSARLPRILTNELVSN